MSCKSGRSSFVKSIFLGEYSIHMVEDYITSHFGCTKSKAEIIHALETCTILHRIPLPAPSVSIEQAQKDFRRERILLNDVAFIPDRDDDERSIAFALTLKVLLHRLMRNHAVYNEQTYQNAEDISDTLMQRACRTSAGSDSFFTIQKMFCIEDTFVTQNTTVTDDPPIHIDVFLSEQGNYNRASRNSTISTVTEETAVLDESPHLCARMLVSNSFAVYDSAAMSDEGGDGSTEPRPWLDIDSIVVDESDLKTNEHWRKLHLVVTHVESGRTFSSIDDAVLELSRPTSPVKPPTIRPPLALQNLTSWLVGCQSSSTSSTSVYNNHHYGSHAEDEDSTLALSTTTSNRDEAHK